MTERAANLFRANEQAMFQIAPAEQTNLCLAASFNSAGKKNDVVPSLPQNDNKIDRRQLVMQAEDVSNSLKETFPEKRQGDDAYGITEVGTSCIDLTKQMFNLFSPKPDENMNPADNDDNLKPQPMLANNSFKPAMGLGMMG